MPALAHLIEAPTVERVRFDLFDTVGIKPMPEGAVAHGITYDTENCATAQAYTPPCVTPTGPKVAEDGMAWVEGESVPVYHLFTCRTVGTTDADRSQRAERALDSGASRVVEAILAERMGTGAVDLGGPFPVALAIAELEQYAAANYSGQAVIHLSRRAALLGIAADAIIRVGSRLETPLGSVVIAGSGYAGSQVPSAPAAGAEWGYVTGAVNVWGSGVHVDEWAMERGAGGGYTNEFAALAEKSYTPTFECIAGAVEIIIEEP